MKYLNIKKAVFIDRPNRFIAHVEVGGKTEIAHVKNTGRCRELLVPGATVFLEGFDLTDPKCKRKTKYDLVAVYKGEKLINMDSAAPNKIFAEWVQNGGIFDGVSLIKPETTFGTSRFDFYIEAGERKIFVEIKGATLEENGYVFFPDAPTLRGVKHINELVHCVEQGFEAYIVFVVQMADVLCFAPNDRTHRAFGDALRRAKAAGVQVLAVDCFVTESTVSPKSIVEVRL